ncbi:4-amino-4-deoxychorismate lyase [Actinoplanes sp. OR16]|uniref:aminotransferase class IV n=1 Tax=Actinoplanes sp. OR16 TaxID=946334 RepID=UPI000F6EBFBD|nr:aminotransferase class IV [Actinoplanes sp. OR16]BBH65001.1 4-amino-4-deoxychorismate lyase [Actinoplanes sp. OR16]
MTERILVSPGDLLGDGVFETIHLRPAGPWLLEEHLARLRRSAEILEMPPPPISKIRTAISEISEMSGVLRIVYTRNRTVSVTVSTIPAAVLGERHDGIRAISARLDDPPPWSIREAKSLSYASNFAARRWAARHGAEEVVWLSSRGYVLEAPTSSVVWLTDGVLATVPPAEAGILAGITAAHLLSAAGEAGLTAAERMITLPDLAAADAIWLASSLRGLAEVTELDGVARGRSPWTPRLLELLGY